MRWVKFIAACAVSLSLVGILSVRIGPMPPVGKFFSPSQGFWQNVPHLRLGQRELQLSGLQHPVHVLFDKRMVPHVFAKNAHDLYFAQGYVTAKDRLWQMEFQTLAAAGRLSEIVGKATLEHDLRQRRTGMVYAAKRTLREMEKSPQTREAVEAYAQGVNAYIDSLSPEEYPLEYKLLDYAPEHWTPLKSALLLKHMAWTLSGPAIDLEMSLLREKLGKETVERLFPLRDDSRPVIPRGTKWDFNPQKAIAPKNDYQPKYLDLAIAAANESSRSNRGSNNWAVSGAKTASGKPMLANDPHLGLNFPSIWYEIQLISPDVNVYGVSIPGAPCVIIGFNEHIAWGVTNAATDVADWYEIRFKDDNRDEYWHDNQWKKTRKITEKIEVRGDKPVIDTVVYTHHGPIVSYKGENYFHGKFPVESAFRWAAHDPSNDMAAFLKLNRAKNYRDFTEALSCYSSPAQNFAFACTDGDIAIWHNGRLPLKWKGQGRYICDGTDPAYDWQGWILQQQNPHIKNPSQGYVLSANQQPVAKDYPYFLGGLYARYRNLRIDERLAEMKKITVDDFRDLQNDNKNLLAASVLPVLLKMLDKRKLKGVESEMFQELKRWDFYNDADKIAPSIFQCWWQMLRAKVWQKFDCGSRHLLYPSNYITANIIAGSNIWSVNIEKKAQCTFAAAARQLEKQCGPFGNAWGWANYKGTSICHLIPQLKTFGRMNLPVGGGKEIVNATGKRWGPSWRMIVSLEQPVKAWGIYPGGQSGNPLSPHYDDFVDTWCRGELAELLFLNSEKQTDKHIVAIWRMEEKK